MVVWSPVCVCPAAPSKSERRLRGVTSFRLDAVFAFLPEVVMRLGCELASSPFLFPLRFFDLFVFPVCWLWSLTIVVLLRHLPDRGFLLTSESGGPGRCWEVGGRGCDLAA